MCIDTLHILVLFLILYFIELLKTSSVGKTSEISLKQILPTGAWNSVAVWHKISLKTESTGFIVVG